MSIYFNQTNITPGTSQYITRNEVVDALSTFSGDLSGVNLSSFFTNPNPTFSSITMNATGSILGAASVSASGALGLSSLQFAYSKPYVSYNFLPSLKDPNTGTYGALATGANIIKTSQTAGQFHTQLTPTQYNYVDTAGNITSMATLNTAAMSAALTNISSINGLNPNTAGTTFTNLTGTNLTTTGVLTSPQIVSVSSINGVPYQIPYSTGWTGGGSTIFPSGAATLVASIALPAAYLQPNTTYLYDVPLSFGAFPPSPLGFTLFVGLRLGGNGQINYQTPLYINASAQNNTISLTGIAQTNPVSVTTNTIDIVCVQTSGSSWTAPVTNPTSAGGLNVYTIKPLS